MFWECGEGEETSNSGTSLSKDSSVCGELDLGKTETTRNGQDWERLKEDADVKAQVMVYSNISPFQQ